MAMDNFKEVFSDAYQEVFQKVLVGKAIANTRFEAGLKYGESVTRIKFDISNVRVRTITNLADRTIDPISDSEELLAVDRKKGTSFPLAVHEETQAGPLNPAAIIGGKVAHKLATYVDADILAETQNAFADFDNGDLTTLASSGTPITLSSTTVPQLVSRAPAKLMSNNQTMTNIVWVVDPYMGSDFVQYLLGKNVDDMFSSTFKNGYWGPVASGELYISMNLTSESVLSMATTPTDGDTVIINGVTMTFKTTLGATAGNVLIGGSADVARANLTALINDPSTTDANQVALSAANQVKFTDTLRLAATNDNSANTMTVVGTGSGRLTVSETFTDGTDAWSKNMLHVYYGKKGAIDVVIQDWVDMEMREEPKQRTTNIFSDVLYGIKTFEDGAQQFLDVLIAA